MPTWARLTFAACDAAWLLLGLFASAGAAALALRPAARARLEAFARERPLLPVVVVLALTALFGAYECARQAIHQLTADSGIMANLAWNAAHGYGLRSSVLGDHSYFAVHFAFAFGALAPVLWLWDSVHALALAQGALVASAPLAVYQLARRKTRDPLLPWLALLLCLSHPAFQELVGTVLDNSVLAFPFFLWAAYFFETDRPWAGVVATLLTLSTREQAPFMLAGVGLLLATRHRRLGLAVAGGGALLWLVEMKVLAAARAAFPCFDNWGYFDRIGGSLPAIVHNALFRPWTLAAALVWPPGKLAAAGRIMAFTGLLPLASGAYLLPALTAWLPHQLANYGTDYQALRGHYPSFVLGPLLWAALHGLLRLRSRLDERAWTRACAGALLVAAAGFFAAPRFYYAEARVVPSAWQASVPRMLARIPADAAVWCDPYLLPDLALRRHVKMLPSQLPDCAFEAGLFAPDYVLFSAYWPRVARPGTAERLLAFLRGRGYAVAAREADLVLLARPSPRAGAPEALSL